MSMMECAHCHEAAEARAMTCCPNCQAMICEACAAQSACPTEKDGYLA